MIRRLKFLLYSIILLLAKRRSKATGKKLLLIKTDEIGDYVLWRNFIIAYAKSTRFSDYSITLVGNKAWRKLYQSLGDNKFADEIWIDKNMFKKKLSYRYKFLREINKGNFGLTINTIYSRGLRPDDSIVIAANASFNIGMNANTINVEDFEKGYDKKLYQELIQLPVDNMFDFYRNRLFTEKVTGDASVKSIQFGIDENLKFEKPASLPNNYFIIFPGSNSPKRIWSTDKFISVAMFVHENYQLEAVLCGGPNDQPYIDRFMNAYPYPARQFKEENGLPDFLKALAHAKFLVSVDTGAVHLAAMMKCPVYGVFNGSQFKRFAPYPPAVHERFYSLYPEDLNKDFQGSSIIPSRYILLSDLSFNDVNPEIVINKIRETYPLYLSKEISG